MLYRKKKKQRKTAERLTASNFKIENVNAKIMDFTQHGRQNIGTDFQCKLSAKVRLLIFFTQVTQLTKFISKNVIQAFAESKIYNSFGQFIYNCHSHTHLQKNQIKSSRSITQT